MSQCVPVTAISTIFLYFYTHTILPYLLLIKRGTPAVLYREELLPLISNKLTKVVWV